MEILVSPNSFKGTFSSVEASNIMAKALKDADSEFNIKKLPIADGGDGTMDVFKYYFDYKSVKRKYGNFERQRSEGLPFHVDVRLVRKTAWQSSLKD